MTLTLHKDLLPDYDPLLNRILYGKVAVGLLIAVVYTTNGRD